MASTAVAVAGGTGDVQAFTGACTLVGYVVRETAGSADGNFILRDGTADTAAIRVADLVTKSTGKFMPLPAIPFSTGIFVERNGGTTEFVLYFA